MEDDDKQFGGLNIEGGTQDTTSKIRPIPSKLRCLLWVLAMGDVIASVITFIPIEPLRENQKAEAEYSEYCCVFSYNGGPERKSKNCFEVEVIKMVEGSPKKIGDPEYVTKEACKKQGANNFIKISNGDDPKGCFWKKDDNRFYFNLDTNNTSTSNCNYNKVCIQYKPLDFTLEHAPCSYEGRSVGGWYSDMCMQTDSNGTCYLPLYRNNQDNEGQDTTNSAICCNTRVLRDEKTIVGIVATKDKIEAENKSKRDAAACSISMMIFVGIFFIIFTITLLTSCGIFGAMLMMKMVLWVDLICMATIIHDQPLLGVDDVALVALAFCYGYVSFYITLFVILYILIELKHYKKLIFGDLFKPLEQEGLKRFNVKIKWNGNEKTMNPIGFFMTLILILFTFILPLSEL